MKIQNGISLQKPTAEARNEQREKQLRDAAKMYENHFLGEMMKAMRSTVHHEDGFIKKGYGEKIFAEQLDQKYVDGWAEKGGVGLADLIYSQIKERYMGTAKRDFGHPAGALPINPPKDPHGLKMPEPVKMKALPPQAENSLEYRFEAPGVGPGASAQAPLAGKVASVERVGQGWTSVGLDHGRGLRSELNFPGEPAQIAVGDDVGVGAALGHLDQASPVVAWKLDWNV